MRNVPLPLCTEEKRTNHMQHFVHRVQYSGYINQERIEVYKCTRKKYQSILKNNIVGIIPLYRGKFWKIEERARERREKADSWYKNGGYDTVMFVDATPNEILADKCRKIMKNEPETVGKAAL